MEIKLDENWALTSDERQYILAQITTRKNKDGEEVEYLRFKSSHSTKKAVIKAWMEILERTEPDLDSWEKVLNFQKEILYPKLEEIGRKVDLCF